jgi:hypothetical protein
VVVAWYWAVGLLLVLTNVGTVLGVESVVAEHPLAEFYLDSSSLAFAPQDSPRVGYSRPSHLPQDSGLSMKNFVQR